MRQWIRKWLGLEAMNQQLYELDRTCDRIERKMDKLYSGVNVNTVALGHILGQIKPILAQAEEIDLNPERRKASDELGEQIIEKLKAEDMARRHTAGEL